jgi:hypothetical protein
LTASAPLAVVPRLHRSTAQLVVAVAVGLVLSAWLRTVLTRSAVPIVSGPLRFVPASVERDAAMLALPGGASEVTRVRLGEPIEVAAVVQYSEGLTSRRAYWARLDRGTGPLAGFVAVEAVAVVGPPPPRMRLSDLRLAAAPATSIEIDWLPDTVTRWQPLLLGAAREHGVDPELLAIVALVESGGDPDALSGSGAVGLMQVMPSTAVDIARQRGLSTFTVADLSDPALNVDMGAWYLARQLEAFGHPAALDMTGSVGIAAAAYNGGPGHVQGHLAGEPLADETVAYRHWVAGMWSERRAPSSATFDAWSKAGGWRLIESASVAQVASGA